MEKKKSYLINGAFYGGILLLLFLAGRYVLPVLTPFFFALVIAYCIRKPAAWISGKTGLAQKKVWLALLAVFYVLLFAAILTGGGKLVSMLGRVVRELPDFYRDTVAPMLEQFLDKAGNALPFADTASSGGADVVDSFGEMLSRLSGTILQYLSGFAAEIPSKIVRVIITVVASFYIASDYGRIHAGVKRCLPVRIWEFLVQLKREGAAAIKAFLRSYTLLFFITFGELTAGLLLLGVPYAPLIALGIAVFDILPVLGTGGILIPWMVVLLVLGDFPMAAGMLVLYLVILLVRNMLEPRLVGKQMGLHPLLTLIAMFAGLELFGIAGLILMPVAAVMLANMSRNGTLRFTFRS